MLNFLAPIVGAGISGLFNSAAADKQAEATAATNAMTREMAEKNMAMQKEFAQHGLTWKIDDAIANKDKIHPIYSMGSSGASFSPVTANFANDTSSQYLAQTGQDISRAVSATATQSQRMDAFSQATRALTLERGQLENELLRTQIASSTARLRQATNPPFPGAGDTGAYLIPGQSDGGRSSASGDLTKPKALEVTPAHPQAPHMEGGSIADIGVARSQSGFVPVPSKDVKERIEDNMPQEWLHFYRNNILPSLGINLSPPPYKPPPDKEWWFNTFRQEYQLLPKGQRPLAGHKWKGN